LNAEPIVQVSAEGSAWRFAPAHVLVVDDGVENRELVRVVLEAAGLRISEAEHGAAALQFIAANPVDLVLMDMQMQVMDGSTATRRLRERGCSVPVIALTAHAMKGYEAEAQAAGFTGWLTKPVDIDAMLELLATHLVARRSGASGAATAGGPALRVPPRADASDAEPIVSRLAAHARLRRVVRNFALQLPAKIDAIDRALTRRDWEELAALGHWLKGAGGTVGYDVFFEPARDLELHARAGDLDAVAQKVARLRSLVQRIVVPNADEADKEQRNELLPAGIPS